MKFNQSSLLPLAANNSINGCTSLVMVMALILDFGNSEVDVSTVCYTYMYYCIEKCIVLFRQQSKICLTRAGFPF